MNTSNSIQETQNNTTKDINSNLFDAVLNATGSQTDRDYTEELIKVITDQAISGLITWDKNLLNTVDIAIKKIDNIISKQITQVLHNEKFQTLEGTWRGLQHLVKNSLCSTQLKIKVLNVDKASLLKNFDKSMEFDQSDLFKKIYEEEFGVAGGQPYGALIGDYEFTNHPQDISLLKYISEVSAASFAPFISAASSSVMGLNSWKDLSVPTDLERIFDSKLYAGWNGFRATDESRFVTLTMPKTLARVPYGQSTCPIEEFDYEEFDINKDGIIKETTQKSYCWMNSAFVYGTVLTKAFSETGFCTATRGVEGGGKVSGLPVHNFFSDDGEIDLTCPTEIGITDRREFELSKLGFLPLCHFKGEDYAVFFGGQSSNKPLKYEDPDITSNAAISARTPYIFASSRIAHYLKVIARDKIGSFMELSDVEFWLNNWIVQYVNSNPASGQALKARFPLAAAKITVTEVPGKPGSFKAIAHLKPWLQLEELTASLRLVAKIPG
jgi:type VI secretion system protein ImpC